MREQLKKNIAIIIVVVLVLTLIQTPMDVQAADITLTNNETVSISTSDNYTVPDGTTLTIANGGSVSGTITVTGTGKLIVENGGSVTGTINVSGTGEIKNYGNMNNVYGNAGTIYNYGTIYYIKLNANSGTINLTNEGTVQYVYAQTNSTVDNKAGGSIDKLYVSGGGAINNSGTVTTELEASSRGTITMSGTSRIEKFSVGYGFLVITSDAGATINNADLSTDDFGTGSSGTITIVNSLSLEGTGTFPLTFNVDSSTKITKSSDNSGWSVNCDGKKYILPVSTFSETSLSDMYKATFSESSIALPDLTVQYDVADVTGETFTISNDGTFKIRWKISNIPEFVELYDATTALSKDDTITLSAGESKTITVKAKSASAADAYTGSISFNVYTAEGATTADDTLMTTKDIPVTLKVNRQEGSGTIEVNDVYYGTPVTCTASSTTNDKGKTVEFKKRDGADNTYSTELPTEAASTQQE